MLMGKSEGAYRAGWAAAEVGAEHPGADCGRRRARSDSAAGRG